MRRRLTGGLTVGLLVAFGIGGSAVAQVEVVIPTDSCFEVDHSGSNPFGSPSAMRILLTVPTAFAGETVELFASGASGEIAGSGTVDATGLVVVDMPLFSYGEHTLEAGVLGSGEIPIDLIDIGPIVIDAAEPQCDPGDLSYPIGVAPTTTTIVPESTTTSVETTTTVAEATTSTLQENTTTSSTPAEVGGEGSSVWIFPILGGLTLIVIGGAVIWRGSDDPCKEELEAWMAAQAECDEARAKADQAQAGCDDARAAVEGLEDDRKDLCKEWPPACWETEDGGWIEESGRPETRITQRDLHMRRMALGEVWDAYRDGKKSAQEVQDAWEQADTREFREQMRRKDAAAKAKFEGIDAALAEARKKAEEACNDAEAASSAAEEACAKAAAAKRAYEECMNAAAPPVDPPKEPEPPTPPPEPPTPPPTGPGTAPPPTEPPSTPPEDEPPEPTCCPSGMWVGYGWTTGGILAIAGYESSIMHFVCLSHSDRWVTMSSRSFRFGLGLGGETALFGAFMWGVPHGTDVPRIWREKAASGFDFDLSFGPSVSKGIKNVIKDAGLKQAGGYLRWAAKQKVPPSALDPRRMENLRRVARGVPGSTTTGTGRSLVSQGAHPQVIVFPLGAGLQAGGWWKVFATTSVTDFRSCGCPWPR